MTVCVAVQSENERGTKRGVAAAQLAGATSAAAGAKTGAAAAERRGAAAGTARAGTAAAPPGTTRSTGPRIPRHRFYAENAA